MLRVMYIVNESGLGGAAQSLLDMLAVNHDRLSPTVIIPSAGIIEERLQQLHVSYFIIPFEMDHRKIGEHSQKEKDRIFCSNYQAALKLQEIVKRQEIQIIHTNSSVSNVGAILALMTGLPHIWHIRELLEEHFGYEFADMEFKKELFECTDRMISISDTVMQSYKRKYGIDSICIYNGIYIDRFLEKNLSKEKKNAFLMAGHITPDKGQLDAIKAVHLLAEQKVEVKLYIVGSAESDYYWWLMHRCVRKYGLENSVHIFKHRKDLRSLRQQCQYSITGSRMEALGRVTIEAMLAGCVVIGADTGGTAEIIGQDCSKGYLYKQGDYHDLARVMRYAIEHSEDNLDIQRTAQNYAAEEFDAGKYIETIIETYESVLQGKKVNKGEMILKSFQERYEMLKDIEVSADLAIPRNQSSDKSQMLAVTIRRWFTIKLEKKSIATALLQRDIHSVAIYGMGYLGKSLYQELEDSSVDIAYVMDRALPDNYGILKLVRLEEELPKTDAVIVTVLGNTDALCDSIKIKCDYQVITLDNLLSWCEEEG